MNFVKQVISVAVIVVATSWTSLSQIETKLSDNRDSTKFQCRDNTSCPTWFICNSQNNCQCGNRHTDIIACDDQKKTSAVLDCHCVTYDNDTRSTFTGKLLLQL